MVGIAHFVFGRNAIFDPDCMLAVRGAKLVVHHVKSPQVHHNAQKFIDSLVDVEEHMLMHFRVLFLDSYSIKDYDWMMKHVALVSSHAPDVEVNTTILDPLFHGDFTRKLRSGITAHQQHSAHIQLLYDLSRFTVSLHVRRGDVDPTMQGRYTSDEYYFEIIKKIQKVESNADIHVFTSLEGRYDPKNFTGYANLNTTIHFEDTADERIAWYHMMHADMLIMAKSSFSEVPALLNPNCVVYDPNYLGKMDRWVVMENFTEDYVRSCVNRVKV